MAAFTVGWKLSRRMIRVGRLVVIRCMAADTRIRRIVVIAMMASFTIIRNDRMCAI